VLTVRDKVGLSAGDEVGLRGALAGFAMLEDVVRWGYSRSPRSSIDVVVQDEFSHDVVLSWEGGRYLVFDTT
jgi:hypothetical protein